MLVYVHHVGTLALYHRYMAKPLTELGRRERQIMDILVRRKRSTAAEVLADLPDQPSYSAVRSMLRLLEEKGYVRHKVEGKAFVYSGIEKPRNVAVRAVRQILDRFCDGSLEQLLVGMVENEVVDRAELRELAKKLAQPPRKDK